MDRHGLNFRTVWMGSACGAVVAAVCMAAMYAPIDPVMGVSQKLVYLHVPAALCAFAACLGVLCASVSYIWQRKQVWDRVASACGTVTVVFSSVVLVTGMAWARDAWGHWWSWSPRLTFSLILWLLFAVYVVLRRVIRSESRRALVCAAYGIIASLDVPLIYVSTRLMPDVHPAELAMTREMEETLVVCMAAAALVAAFIVEELLRYATRHEPAGEDHGGLNGGKPGLVTARPVGR